MELSEGLNPAQLEAMTHDSGPALIVAGAGTGKTTVITRRIAWLVEQKKAKPSEILAVTYTDKAATEMESRVDLLLPNGVMDANITTFHGLGEQILRDNVFELGLPSDFRILTNVAQALFIEELIDEMDLKYYRPIANPYSFVKALIGHFSKLKDEGIAPHNYLKFAQTKIKKAKDGHDRNDANKILELANIYNNYNAGAHRKGWLDFGDLINLSTDILNKNPNILKSYQQRFKYILVDEFQDTNTTQAKIIELLSKNHQNIFVVGDDDQSIYRFRGASISNILNFKELYPRAKQIILNQNYRSSQPILDASHRLIKHNDPDRLESKYHINKKLISQTDGELAPIQREFESLPQEAKYIAEKIKRHIEKGTSPSEIAILLRKNNQAEIVRNALNKVGISYQEAQSMKLLERPEIKILINFIALMAKPEDNGALYGLMVGDIYEFDIEEVVKYTTKADRAHLPLLKIIENLSEDKKITQLLAFIQSCRDKANDLSAGELLYDFIDRSGYLEKLKIESRDDPEPALKLLNISHFLNIVKEFELSVFDPNIYNFWRHLDRITGTEAVDITAEQSPLDQDSVQIMTIHKAKGLEFDVVFMIDLNARTFPSDNRKDLLPLDDELLTYSHPTDFHKSEERRLFYVGMTRAKKYLYLTNAKDHGGKQLKKMSQFIAEAIEEVNSANLDVGKSGFIDSYAKTSPKAIDLVRTLYHEDWLHLTTNDIDNYLRSPLEFWYYNILKLPKTPNHPLVFGSAIHAVIEFYYKTLLSGQTVELSKLYEVFESSWSSEGFVTLAHEHRRYDRGRRIIKSFYDKQQKLGDIPSEVEKPFTLNLPDLKLRISGRYDAVYTRGDGVEVRDFKTGDVSDLKKAQEKLRNSIQLKIYALAWERQTGQPVQRVGLHFVEHDILVTSDKIDHEKTLSAIGQVVDGINQRKFSEKGQSMTKLGRLL